jgi:DnaJ like chaperone protein
VQVLAKASIASATALARAPKEDRDPYKTLRVERTATDAELRAAWMNGLKASHPDRLAALNMDASVVYAARKACQRINAAYDEVMRERRGTASAA